MDISRLGRGERLAAVSAIALFIFMFFNWYGVGTFETPAGEFDVSGFAEGAGVDTSWSAWQAFDFIDIILLATVIATVGLAAMKASRGDTGGLVAGSAIVAGLGILSALLVAYRVIDPPGEGDIDREIGLWLGLIAVIGVAVGGWMAMQEEGTSFGEAADQVGDRISGGRRPPPPPPPPPASAEPPPPSEGPPGTSEPPPRSEPPPPGGST